MKRIIGFIFLGFVIGIIIGSIGTFAFLGYKISKAMFMLQEVELLRSEDAAIQAYLNESPEIGIWALENYIDNINRVIKERKVENNKQFFWIISPKSTLTCSYARLALLYEKTGDEITKKESFEKAFKYSEKIYDSEKSEEYLIRLVRELDDNFEPLEVFD